MVRSKVMIGVALGVALDAARLPDVVLGGVVLAYASWVLLQRRGARRLAAEPTSFAIACAALGGAILMEGLGYAWFALFDPPRTAAGAIAVVPLDLPPSWLYPTTAETAAHGVFHILTASGVLVMCAVLLVGLASRPPSSVPVKALVLGGAWLAPTGVLARLLYGPVHPVLTVASLWLATVIGAWVSRGRDERPAVTEMAPLIAA